MPIEMIFSSEVRDEAATERALSVQTSMPIGVLAWLDDPTSRRVAEGGVKYVEGVAVRRFGSRLYGGRWAAISCDVR
jgi:hypothetical protein